MRILVTGANGQVGTCLEKLLSASHDILAVDKEQLDITDPLQVKGIFNQFQPEVVVNAAAYTAVDKAEDEESMAYAVNRDAVELLAKATEERGAMLIHISTDYVFDGQKSGLYAEDDMVCPCSVYGESKLAGELVTANFCQKHIIIRTAWVFSEYGNNFVKTMLRLARERDSFGVVADQFGGPTYAGDIAALIGKIIEKYRSGQIQKFGLFHYSGLPHVSWYEFATTIFAKAETLGALEQIPSLTPLTTADYPTRARRPNNSKLDTSKTVRLLEESESDWQSALDNIIPIL